MSFDDVVRRSLQRFSLALSDVCALVVAYYAAIWLRFDGEIPPIFLARNPGGVIGAIVVYLLIFAFFRLYRFSWRFASLDTLFSVVMANTLGLAAASVVIWMTDTILLPRSVLILIWLCSILLIGALRISLRMIHIWFNRYGQRARYANKRPVNCLILGTGDEGVHAAKLLLNRMVRRYHIVGFLDHRTPCATGDFISGSKILGGLHDLSGLAERGVIDEVIIALPQADGQEIRRIALECRSNGITPRVIPSLDASLRVPVVDLLPEVSVEDLLRRDPVTIDADAVHRTLHDRVVLVTGAGGSIGSELCRQIMRHLPRRLILMGHGENSIHAIAGELVSSYPEFGDRLSLVIADMRDTVCLEQLFAQERPEIVVHAAAHKHVPLMELNPREAVKNNVGGTRNLAQLAGRFGAERFVMVSTDKAVNPSSIMGATKWVCEEIVRRTAVSYPETRYITTRFGNVLGSRGSVVPIFHEQLLNGGPITVTHPRMTRYFMTIPEASQLVLYAGAVGESGQVLVLDMGEPVAIVDLAREMIRLAGLVEGRDIKIVFTGLRPGEKLTEELFGAREQRLETSHPGLFRALRPQYLPPQQCDEFIDELLEAAEHWDPDRVCELLAREMPSLRRVPVLDETAPNELLAS